MMKKNTFQRALKLRHIIAVSVGGTISSTYFLGNGYILHQIGPFAFLAFIFGGLITYLVMSCMAELAANEDPTHHSFVGYTKEFISPTWACGVGWSYWFNWIMCIATECISGGILMHSFFPNVHSYIWSTAIAVLITYVNIKHVKVFAHTSFWLTFTHIMLFASFSLFAILIFFGVIEGEKHPILSTHFLIGEGGMFPNGIAVFFINMVILLLNFQGTEILGLSASEAHRPKKDIPKSMKEIGIVITLLYVIPIFLLPLIYPWQEANTSKSVFAAALESYGFTNFAAIFTVLIIAGMLSCSNSGLFASARALHALAAYNMSPKFLGKLNIHGVPAHATVFTFVTIWITLIVAYFFPEDQVYAILLALSGFTGTFAWIAICWSQIESRKRLQKAEEQSLRFKMPGFPYLSHFAIWSQVFCLFILILSQDLRPSFYISVPVIVIPMLLYKFRKNIFFKRA